MAVKTWQEYKNDSKVESRRELIKAIVIGTLVFSIFFGIWYFKG